jgi:hypothetical protein
VTVQRDKHGRERFYPTISNVYEQWGIWDRQNIHWAVDANGLTIVLEYATNAEFVAKMLNEYVGWAEVGIDV